MAEQNNTPSADTSAQSAFAEKILKCLPKLVSLAAFCLPDRLTDAHDADDLIQFTCLKAWQSARRMSISAMPNAKVGC